MLEAAEELFREGGGDALTVEAVIERAGTSTGSFYARFGSRRGLFVAMHERFLETFGAAVQAVALEALDQSTLHESLHTFFTGVLTTVRRHRDTLLFHVIQNAHEPEMRAQGNAVTQGAFVLIVEIVRAHSSESESIDLDKIDLIGRTLHGLTLESMLFDSKELTGRMMSDEQCAELFTEMVMAYL